MEGPPPVVRSCPDCDGRGVLIGPLDPETKKRETRECRRCDGFGCKVLRPRPAGSNGALVRQ